jgi:drug/metabolite transporter (DMT)-like permease
MYEKYKYQIWLHIAVFIFGTTGILGKLISLDSFHLVWYRLVIAVTAFFAILYFGKSGMLIGRRPLIKILGAGVILVVHWITFFEAIKRSNVSVALVCLSSSAFFTSILEPLYYRRRMAWHEPFFGLCIIVGLYCVFSFEFEYLDGMILGIVSALFAAWFTVLNALLVRETDAKTITLYELLGALGSLTVLLLVTGGFRAEEMAISWSDFGWLLILGTVGTAFSFSLSVQLVKRLTPYTFVMAINLEPIYAMILAVLIWPESETMSGGFYAGAAIVVAVIFLNAMVSKRRSFV